MGLLSTSLPILSCSFRRKGPALDSITDETLAAQRDEIEALTFAKVAHEADPANGHHQYR
jgi:hypothetical protein